jgi:hypothetical protein
MQRVVKKIILRSRKYDLQSGDLGLGPEFVLISLVVSIFISTLNFFYFILSLVAQI